MIKTTLGERFMFAGIYMDNAYCMVESPYIEFTIPVTLHLTSDGLIRVRASIPGSRPWPGGGAVLGRTAQHCTTTGPAYFATLTYA